MVYDASKSGLNNSLWVPSFHLLSVNALVHVMSKEPRMGGMDLTDMLLNFTLDHSLRPYCGIDLSPYIHGAKSRE